MSARHVLFAYHDRELGHATRDPVLIRALLDAGHRFTVLSSKESVDRLPESLVG